MSSPSSSTSMMMMMPPFDEYEVLDEKNIPHEPMTSVFSEIKEKNKNGDDDDDDQQQQLFNFLLQENITRAAKTIRNAKHIIITAGAGASIDSGIPAYRTKEGLWKAYPPFRQLGLEKYSDVVTPDWLNENPEMGWAFWSHCITIYRNAKPHTGYNILLKWANAAREENFPVCASYLPKEDDDEDMKEIRNKNYFVFTSNVDGQFQKAGFDEGRVFACHGEVKMLQCTDPKCAARYGTFEWPKEFLTQDPIVAFDEKTLHVADVEKDVPHCPKCNELARPNVMMFNDPDYTESYQMKKEHRLGKFMSLTRPSETVVIEIGAGTAIPTVRRFGEALAKRGCAMIRINPDESGFPERLANDRDLTLISIPLGSKDALERIDKKMNHEDDEDGLNS